MLASSQTIAPKPAALPPAMQPSLPTNGSAGGPSFAQFLNDQPTLPASEASDASAGDAESPNGEPTAAPATARRPASTAPAKPAQKSTPDTAASAKPEAAAAKRDAVDDDVATEDAAQNPETSGLDEFTQLIGMASQALPTPPASMPAADTAPGEAPAGRHGRSIHRLADDDGLPAAARTGSIAEAGGAAERLPADAPARDTGPRAKAVDLAAADKAAARSAATSSETLQTAAASGGSSTSQAAATPTALPTSFAAVLAQAMPTATATATADAAPTSASGQVHAALHSNAFAPELGARVSLLAVDGVQHAELQLNPADMGPVAVQIVVDGSQAQVSFHAVQAETRQALEQSLPDLAAALQSQGLTLSGGGVFQQAKQDSQGGDAETGQGGDARGSRTNTAGGSSAGSPVAAPVRRSVGLLDTFA